MAQIIFNIDENRKMIKDQIKKYYASGIEANRLNIEEFRLEGIRTKEIIERYIKKDRLEILDIGGGAGFYSFWLQEKGHEVTLIDLSPDNINLVKKNIETSGIKLKNYDTGDAVDLRFSDDLFDMILFMGPLYHLTERVDRVNALREARRVLKTGGVLIAAVISRYASLIDGLQRDLIVDDQFFSILLNDLRTGTHLNGTDNLEYFTSSHFHTPEEIVAEIEESGLIFEKLIPVESFGWMVRNFSEKEKDIGFIKKLFETINLLEANEDLLPISPHIIAVARKE